MRIAFIFINHDVITMCRFAHKVPEIAANKQFLISKELAYPPLFPWLAFTIAVICCGKVYSDFIFRAECVGQYTVLLKQSLFFRAGFFVVKVAAYFEFYQIVHARFYILQIIVAFMSFAMLCSRYPLAYAGVILHLGYLVFLALSVFIYFEQFCNIVCLTLVYDALYVLTYFVVERCNIDSHFFKHIAKTAVKGAGQSRVILYFSTKSGNEDIMYLHVDCAVLVMQFSKVPV